MGRRTKQSFKTNRYCSLISKFEIKIFHQIVSKLSSKQAPNVDKKIALGTQMLWAIFY
jgi:hypothetical protein